MAIQIHNQLPTNYYPNYFMTFRAFYRRSSPFIRGPVIYERTIILILVSLDTRVFMSSGTHTEGRMPHAEFFMLLDERTQRRFYDGS